MNITTKSFKLKTGEVIPAGLPVTFDETQHSVCFVHGSREKPYRVRTTAAFHAPTLEQLEEWTMDSICESVLGEQVEPDGTDEHGSPSWLLVFGVI